MLPQTCGDFCLEGTQKDLDFISKYYVVHFVSVCVMALCSLIGWY